MNRKITFAFVAVCCLPVTITVVSQGGADTCGNIQQLENHMLGADNRFHPIRSYSGAVGLRGVQCQIFGIANCELGAVEKISSEEAIPC